MFSGTKRGQRPLAPTLERSAARRSGLRAALLQFRRRYSAVASPVTAEVGNLGYVRSLTCFSPLGLLRLVEPEVRPAFGRRRDRRLRGVEEVVPHLRPRGREAVR